VLPGFKASKIPLLKRTSQRIINGWPRSCCARLLNSVTGRARDEYAMQAAPPLWGVRSAKVPAVRPRIDTRLAGKLPRLIPSMSRTGASAAGDGQVAGLNPGIWVAPRRR